MEFVLSWTGPHSNPALYGEWTPCYSLLGSAEQAWLSRFGGAESGNGQPGDFGTRIRGNEDRRLRGSEVTAVMWKHSPERSTESDPSRTIVRNSWPMGRMLYRPSAARTPTIRAAHMKQPRKRPRTAPRAGAKCPCSSGSGERVSILGAKPVLRVAKSGMKSNSIDGCHHGQIPSPVHSAGRGNGHKWPHEYDVTQITLVVRNVAMGCKLLMCNGLWQGNSGRRKWSWIRNQARRRLRSSSGMRSWRTRACSMATPVM